MAYNLVAQADEANDLHLADSSLVEPPASTDYAYESIASTQHTLGSLINSIKNHEKQPGYEMVEDDDYDEMIDPDAATAQNKLPNAGGSDGNALVQTTTATVADSSSSGAEIARSTSPEPLVRTSSDVSIPLRHPTPDLQSLQGAYVGNIERLERSAERLSMTSSDLGVELRKLDLEQKRRSSASSTYQGPESPSRQMSTGSLSNSIIAVNSAARSGGYSPAGFMSSPRGSILSGSRFRSTSVTSPLKDIQEPNQEDDAESDTSHHRDVPILTPVPLPLHVRNSETTASETGTVDETEPQAPARPLTAQSTDTYQQATDLFLDFDGVHFVPHRKETTLSRQLSLNKPPLASTAEHYQEPQAGQDLVFYPAPIPKLLNLPQRLSRQPAKPNHEKRRTQFMDIVIDKKDTKPNDAAEQRASKRLSTLPPQLRASVFFDAPSSNLASLGVQLKDQSAVSTLDSILDASTHAPVSAFIDHPIVGSAGANVYAPEVRKRASRLPIAKNAKDTHKKKAPGPRESALFPTDEHGHSDNEATQRESGHTNDSDWDHRRSHSQSSGASSAESDDSGEDEEGEGEEEGEEEEEDVDKKEDFETEEPILFGRPTTLLAELQMRKQEQKQRTRTAANAFPNGMHSTLLELDAVAQAQSNKRRQKTVTLAWETEAVEHSDEADDEDIPLGLLYPNKDAAAEDRPLGLMERREMEENEPLSKRRARLRGEPIPTPMPNRRASTMTQLQTLAGAEPDSGDEGETLAQRLRRLKQGKERRDKSKSIVSVEFENEIMAELGKLREPVEAAVEKPAALEAAGDAGGQGTVTVNEEEETLGQRRKRLQAEGQQQKQPGHSTGNVRASKSMADILQSYPSNNEFPAPGSIHTHRLSTAYTTGAPSMAGFAPGYAGYGARPVHGNIAYNPSYIPGGVNVYSAAAAHNAAMMQQNIADTRQRDVIDRWRQSVVR